MMKRRESECYKCKHIYRLKYIKMVDNKAYCLVCAPLSSLSSVDERMVVKIKEYAIIDDYN